jgi:hypothetical protein
MINLQPEINPMAISKVLSPNDTGETGAHQAGILIPKNNDILPFFPKLGTESKNPRVKMKFIDISGEDWNFTFIYYNNKFFDGTRNEFRLTGMTAFIRQNNLVAGDKIILSCDIDGKRIIRYERTIDEKNSPAILKLGGSWKVVKI